MPSTWEALSSSQEELTLGPVWPSTMRMASSEISLNFYNRDVFMAAATTTMRMEPRNLLTIFVTVLSSLNWILQTFLVTGGRTPDHQEMSSTELLLETGSAWVLAGDLPSPRFGLRGANINKKILMAGIREIKSLILRTAKGRGELWRKKLQ